MIVSNCAFGYLLTVQNVQLKGMKTILIVPAKLTNVYKRCEFKLLNFVVLKCVSVQCLTRHQRTRLSNLATVVIQRWSCKCRWWNLVFCFCSCWKNRFMKWRQWRIYALMCSVYSMTYQMQTVCMQSHLKLSFSMHWSHCLLSELPA